MFYHDLKQEVHNGGIVHSTDTTHKSIKQTLQMYGKYQRKGKVYHSPIKSEEGVACVQQGEVNTVPVILTKGGKKLSASTVMRITIWTTVWR